MYDLSKVTIGTLLEGMMQGDVLTAQVDTPLCDCAKQMGDHQVGSLIIKSNGKTAGIVTLRDFVWKATANNLDSAETPVKKIMTPAEHLIIISKSYTIQRADELMLSMEINHLPVAEDGDNKEIRAIVSSTDIRNAPKILNLVEEIRTMRAREEMEVTRS